MSVGQESEEPVKPRLCERCGKRMPPQKRGRPRRWCSQQCRQSAYEERHNLESWADKQPKVNSLSDVVEVAQTRGARRDAWRGQPASDPRWAHATTDCLKTVSSELLLMAIVVERVVDTVRDYGVINTAEGRILAGHVAELVNAVLERSASVVSAESSSAPSRRRSKAE